MDLLPACDYDYDFGLGPDTGGIFQGLGDCLDWNLGAETAVADDSATAGLLDDLAVPNVDSMGVTMGSTTALEMPDNFLSQHLANTFTMTTTPNTSQSSTTSTPLTLTNNPSKSPSSIPGTSAFSLNPSPAPSSQKRKASPEEDESTIAIKRQRNTAAARKYRQKRLDRVTELENALKAMTGDRDDLRLRLARKEAEVDALREMLNRK